jgi:hypothetical protein
MTDPKEFQSVDELFRKTFDNLDAAPAPNGWDTPSDRVWEHVQTQIRPKSGWSAGAWTTLAVFAVTLMVGLYWAMSSPSPTTEPTPVPAAEQPKTAESPTAPAATQPAAVEEVPNVASPATASAPAQRRSPAARTTTPHTDHNTTSPVTTPVNPSEKPVLKAQPLPGNTDQEAPNTTEALRRQVWKKPLAPLPLRVVPAEKQ